MHTCGLAFRQAATKQRKWWQKKPKPLPSQDPVTVSVPHDPPKTYLLYTSYLGVVSVPVLHAPVDQTLRLETSPCPGLLLRTLTYTPHVQLNVSCLSEQPCAEVNVETNHCHGYVMALCDFHLSHDVGATFPTASASPYREAMLRYVQTKHPFLMSPTHFKYAAQYERLRTEYAKNLSTVDVHFVTDLYFQFLHAKDVLRQCKICHGNVFYSVCGIPDLDNAYYAGAFAAYGTGQRMFRALTSLDIVGHELTHGVIQTSCNLQYRGHSGALNESFADIFSVAFEHFAYQTHPGLQGKFDWLVGEDVMLHQDALRNFQNPHLHQQPRSLVNDRYVVHPRSRFDNGGVHVNSGIINHLFYNVASGMGITAAFDLFARVLFQLSSKATFRDFSVSLQRVSRNHPQKACVLKGLRLAGLLK